MRRTAESGTYLGSASDRLVLGRELEVMLELLDVGVSRQVELVNHIVDLNLVLLVEFADLFSSQFEQVLVLGNRVVFLLESVLGKWNGD